MNTDLRIIEDYPRATPDERVNMILDYYSRLDYILNFLRIYLVNTITELKRAEAEEKRGENVRVQNSHFSDPTAETAVQHIDIEEFLNSKRSIRYMKLDDESALLVRDRINAYRKIRKDYLMIGEHLEGSNNDRLTMYHLYLSKQKTVTDIADEQGVTERAIRNRFKNTRVEIIELVSQFID